MVILKFQPRQSTVDEIASECEVVPFPSREHNPLAQTRRLVNGQPMPRDLMTSSGVLDKYIQSDQSDASYAKHLSDYGF
jgi:hypothetical protein